MVVKESEAQGGGVKEEVWSDCPLPWWKHVVNMDESRGLD
jgi:hypothetical protein